MVYSIKQLADLAGLTVRTLHYYDEVGLLKPESRKGNGYRVYGEKAVIRLQQIMFFKELDFPLDEIAEILSRPDFDVLEALHSHRALLIKKADRLDQLVDTVDKTILKLKGETKMDIKEYYRGFSGEQIEKYREEVRQRWGEKTFQDSEERMVKMGCMEFAEVQAEGGKIFQSISDHMAEGFDSDIVQALIAEWQQWLENFHHYSAEEVSGLGQAYSQDPRFAKFFRKYHQDLPDFLSRAVEYSSTHKK
jgi:MerR family transcriptional regulator, thiopeptide resistance regulator